MRIIDCNSPYKIHRDLTILKIKKEHWGWDVEAEDNSKPDYDSIEFIPAKPDDHE